MRKWNQQSSYCDKLFQDPKNYDGYLDIGKPVVHSMQLPV